jgi:SAM-dependent methyltransferase
MRILDVGCGGGAVSFLAAELVGPEGAVLGVDRDSSALDLARTRAADLRMGNVTFAQADLNSLSADQGLFDAIVCRRVLMYQPDAVAALSQLHKALKPGGAIAVQEHSGTAMPICRPPMPLHERASRWIFDTVKFEGADTNLGFNLAPAFGAAGFSPAHIQVRATLLTPDQSHTIGAIIRSMLNRIERAGAASAAEIDVESLDERLAEERRTTSGTCVWELVFCAWASKPQ